MGQKTHPVGFRLGIIRDWDATWFAAKGEKYRVWLQEDLGIRKSILGKYPDAGISHVKIERSSNEVTVTLHTSRPGIVIGRGGQRIDELRHELEQMTGKRSRVNVQEIRQAELDATLVARSVADQLQRRIAFRRAMRQAVQRATQAGAKGIKIVCSGRLAGAEIARTEKVMVGRVPLHTLRADIDYGMVESATVMGRIGVKVWIYKGDVLPKPRETSDELGPIQVTLPAAEADNEGGSINAATAQS